MYKIQIGLTIIGVDYAILSSFLIAVVDILPVLGTGTVVIPWMIVCFITGDIPRGVGLLVVYFMQPSVVNSLIFTGCGLGFRLFLEYFFYYVMWGYDNSHLILLGQMLPCLLYTSRCV